MDDNAPLKEPEPPEKPTAGKIIIGLLLTLLALPFLLVATCIPAVWTAQIAGGLFAMVVWAALTIGIGIWRAIVTKNPGVRWGIILLLVAAAISVMVSINSFKGIW